MDRKPLKMPVGIVKNSTPAGTAKSWSDASLVRWVDGALRPWGGWDKIDIDNFASIPRSCHTWTDNSGVIRTAVLCDNHLYVIDGGSLFDITPADGIIGPNSDVNQGGFGDGPYNYDTYGTERPERITMRYLGPAFSLNNWGEHLIAMVSTDGRLLHWIPNTAMLKAEAVPSAPISNRMFVVTPERHVMLFCMGGDFRTFGWCSQEDISDWNMASTLNTAGYYEVEPAAQILCAISTPIGTAFWTATKMYWIVYQGTPYIYTYKPVGDNLTPVSYASAATYSDSLVWLSENGFWTFNGGIPTPMDCPVFDWYRENVNIDHARYKAWGMNLFSMPEVLFFFPMGDNTECNAYIQWNYKYGWWSIGMLSRTAGNGATYSNYPIMVNQEGAYYHEKGDYYNGADALPYISGYINQGYGSVTSTIIDAIVDDGANPGDVGYTFSGALMRSKNSPVSSTHKLTARSDGLLEVRFTARDIKLKIETIREGVGAWTFGEMLVKIAGRWGR